MPTISDLFKNQKKELYGKSDAIRIDTRGLINPPRGAALLLSSPNSLGDLIGNQIAGAVGGSANRPSDTIFKNNSFLAKPISLFKTPGTLRTAVDAKTDYFVKQSPAGASILGKIKEGTSNPIGTVLEVGIDLLKGLKDKNPTKGLPYGQKYQTTQSGKVITGTKTFSKFYQKYEESINPITGESEFVAGGIEERDKISLNERWDSANYSVNNLDSYNKDQQEYVERNKGVANQVWVTFKKYGNNEIIPFAGTITGLSEDVTPEWTNFKYLGSPFKTYRYQGVERTLTFNLQLYYMDDSQKDTMIKKINYLKSLTFPYEHIAQFTYHDNGGNPTGPSSQYAFSPNLFYLSIGDMYKNIFGFIETLSFTVDDNITWPNENFNMLDGGDNTLYPSVVTVSITMKIIENHQTEQESGITKYRYNFDGLDMNIIETEVEKQAAASALSPLSTGNGNNTEPSVTNKTTPLKKKKKKKAYKYNPDQNYTLTNKSMNPNRFKTKPAGTPIKQIQGFQY